MRFANKFPYTNINNINLDWIIKRVKELGETVLGYAADIANAVALAEAAQDAADSVTGIAESAVTTAQAAEATANAIAGTANTALSTAQAAEETAQAAVTTANAIAGTANTALSTAQAANTTAQAAEETAQAAEETAQAAETTADTAAASVAGAVQTANTALATADAANSRAALANSTANEALSTARAAQTSADETVSDVAFLTDEVSEQKNALNQKAGILRDTVSGAIASFVPDSTIDNLLGVSVDIEPVQAGSGVPSPDNVRPIFGRNSVDIIRSGADTSDQTTYTIALGQTVYGGTLDVTNGVLRGAPIKRKLSDFSWDYNSSTGFFYTNFVQASQFFVTACDTYAVAEYSVPAASRPDFSIQTGASGTAQRRLFVIDSAYTTAEDFIAARGNVEIVYTLVNPAEIPLYPVTITTIAGQTNNVWADAGNVSVEFAADLKWYIDGKIAELQALTLENGG